MIVTKSRLIEIIELLIGILRDVTLVQEQQDLVKKIEKELFLA